MSIAFGIITQTNAFTASDGRISGGNQLKDDFDKTFLIENGNKRFIGAFTGNTVQFDWKCIGTHLREIMNDNPPDDFDDVIDYLINNLSNRIENIDRNAPGYNFNTRCVFLILIGSRTWDNDNIEMYHISFMARNGKIDTNKEQINTQQKVIGGNDSAVAFVEGGLVHGFAGTSVEFDDFSTRVITGACRYDPHSGGVPFFKNLL